MTTKQFIPFNKPYVAPKSIEYIKEVLSSSHHQGGGPFNEKAAKKVSKINGGGEVYLTGSCTQALEMATLLLDLKPEDEVIMPSYTFTSAATALANYGVIPVFVDIEPRHLNIDPNKVREAITEKTKAISIVNYAGHACDFESLNQICNEFDLLKIEDNAHGFGVVSEGTKLGTWGDVSTLSFHATKNIQCGEGGALIVNNPKFIEKSYLIQEKGTNRKLFLSGQIEKYQWVEKGGSYLMSEVTAALLLAQLEIFDEIQNKRKKITNSYNSKLNVDKLFDYRILNGENLDQQSDHMFALLTKNNHRNNLQEFLKLKGIQANFHYQDLANSQAGMNFGRKINKNRISEYASDSLLRLPLWYELSDQQVDYIIENVNTFVE